MNPEDRMRDLMKGSDASERPSEAEWDAFVGRAHRSLVMHRALSVAAVVVVLALGAIGGRAILDATRVENDLPPVEQPGETDPPGFTPTPTRTSSPGPEETTEAPVQTTVVQQWFIHGDEEGGPKLVLTYTEIPAVEGIARATLEKLIE